MSSVLSSTNLTHAFLEHLPPTLAGSPTFITASAAFGVFLVLIFTTQSLFAKGGVLAQTPFLGSLGFFNARHEFMDTTLKNAEASLIKQNKDKKRGGVYSFKIANYKVNVLHGEIGRKMFFGDKNLSLYHGYLFLRGGFPTTSKMGEEVEVDNSKLKERLLHFVRREYISDVLPLMYKDINRELSRWGNSGKMDPYQTVYNFLFQFTSRLFVCNEMADNDQLTARIRQLYWTMDDAANSVTNLMPWLPTKKKRASENAMKDLAKIIVDIIDARKSEGRRHNDPLQYLIDLGDSQSNIIQYTFKIIFAASLNTGAITAWVLVYLAMHPDQAEAALTELIQAADNTGYTGTLAERLTHVPLDAWEGAMPNLELIIKETIRIVFAILALRRNVQDPVTIDGKTIGKGDFLAYPIHDVHLNPDLYPEPETWNPGRWLDTQRHESTAWPFLGWGVARFPCTGMRIAKVEIKTIVGLALATYRFKAVDEVGKPLKRDPQPDRNDWQKFLPIEPIFLTYERR